MPYTVRHYSSLEIVEIVYSGVVNATELRAATTDAVAVQRRQGVMRFVVNLGDHEVRVTPQELERLLDEQYWQDDVNRSSRIAIIQPGNAATRAAAEFFVAACGKRGWKSAILPDRGAAMDWLAGTSAIRS